VPHQDRFHELRFANQAREILHPGIGRVVFGGGVGQTVPARGGEILGEIGPSKQRKGGPLPIRLFARFPSRRQQRHDQPSHYLVVRFRRWYCPAAAIFDDAAD
jgi:hypothetical protein